MSFSSANYMLQEAYHKLVWSIAEKKEIMKKLAAAGITPPSEEKFNSFCNIYASYHDMFMQSYETRTVNVTEFLNNQLAKIEEFSQKILKEIHDDKQRIDQAALDQEEHLRALKLSEDEIRHYKEMQERLEREYQAWRAQQEEERKERERLLAVIHSALNELFSELYQSDETHDFLFDGKYDISINFSDAYKNVEGITRDYFKFSLHEEDFIERRNDRIQQMFSDKIDAVIHERPRHEHNRLLATKDEVVIREASKMIKLLVLNMEKQSAYNNIQEVHKSLINNHGMTYVKRAKNEVSEVSKVVSKKKEVVSEKKEMVSEANIETNQKEEKSNKAEKEFKEERIKTITNDPEQKTKEKSSEAQVIYAFSDTQIKREKTNSQAIDQDMKDITDLLKGLQTEEKKSPEANVEATKTNSSNLLPQKPLFPLISTPNISKASSKNDPDFNGEQQASSAPARRRRF